MWTFRRHPKYPRSIAIVITAWYVVLGTLWIVVTDLLLYGLAHDPLLIAKLESTLGWVFVVITAVLVFVITDRAVSRLVRAESTMRAVVDSIADGVVIVGPDQKIKRANRAAARLLGTTHEELIGLGPEEFTERFRFSRVDGRLVTPDQLISLRVLKGEQPAPFRARLHPPNRPEVVLLVSQAPVRMKPTGPVIHAVSVIHDVTDLDRLEQLRDQFFSNAAHALKTPVAVLMAQAHLLSDDPSRGTSVINRQCGRLHRLIDNVAVHVRLQTHNLELHPERVDCAEVVYEVSVEMSAAHGQHGLVTTIDAHPAVFADRESLAQIVRNVIEVAYRCSVTRTDVTLIVDETESHARIRVAYEPLETANGVVTEAAGFEGLSVERQVVESLVAAMRGRLGSSRDAGALWTDWIEIPKEKYHAG